MLTVALVAAVLTALTTLAVLKRHQWAERGITFGVPYPVLASAQNILAFGGGLLVADRFGTAEAVGAAAFTWLAVLAVASDLSSQMLPREACNSVTLIGIPGVIASWSTPTAFALITCAVGLIGAPWLCRIITRRGLGFGDIRLLTAATITLSWWVGEAYMLYAVIGACIVQALVHLVTWPWRHRIGTHEARLADNKTDTVTLTDGDAEASITRSSGTSTRTRRMLPFAPALVASIMIAVAYVTATGYDACAQWPGAVC